jgi:DNA-binding Lrp family transcriptional regulator
MADGYCAKLENREVSISYRQCNKEILNLYNAKIKRLFGTINYPNEYFIHSRNIFIPTILSSILCDYYNLNAKNFLENNARLPKKMIGHSNEHILSVLIAFIVDEGTIDSGQIVIGLHNRGLLNDLQKICDILDYHTSLKIKSKQSHFYILADGVKKFWKDYKKLKEKYPEVCLGYKENQIENFILRKDKKWRTVQQGETKNLIIELLKESPKTIKDLAKILRISRQGIKWHIKELEGMRIIKKEGIGYSGSHIYNLKNYIKLPIKKRGRSRQYGITNDNILNLLKKESLTTVEISKKLGINRATMLHFLYNLEKQNEIVSIRRRGIKPYRSIFWQTK